MLTCSSRIPRTIWPWAAVLLLLGAPMLVSAQNNQDQVAESKEAHPETPVQAAPHAGLTVPEGYTLGPGDEIVVWARDAAEIPQRPIKIENDGSISIPLAGRLQAAGLTISQLEAALVERLKEQILQPQVTVNVTDFRSQPVSVIGAVNKPGVLQLQGRKSLFEMLSMAEGLRQDAGHSVKVTRRIDRWGRLPLSSAKDDPTGQFSVATVNLKSIMEARNPEENIQIKPDDVISVPRAEMVYVIGEVKKSGGFVLNEHENISVLQALSLAEGLNHTASAKNSKILRPKAGSSERIEIAVDVNRILSGKGEDVRLNAEDILFIPNSAARSAGIRALETAIQMGTGFVIWRR
jgi:polysaccharide export outer membrane protein